VQGDVEDGAAGARRQTVSVAPPSDLEVAVVTVAGTAVVLALGYLSGSAVWLLGLLVFLPGVASALCSVRQTRYVFGWTVVVVVVPMVFSPGNHGRILDRLLMLLLTLALGVASVYTCGRRIRREQEMVRLRSTAVAMQRHILRPLPMVTDEVIVDGVYEPVQEDRLIGGDIYDVVDSPWGTRVLIGDVQGKGLSALGAAFAVIGAFRAAAHREPTLTALVDALDAAVVRHNAYAAQAGDDERFVTALVVSVDAEEEAQAINCGHVAPQVLFDGHVTTPELAAAVPLGLAELAAEPATVGWFDFPRGSTLLLTTDGLTEVRDSRGRFYPLTEAVAERVALPPTALPQALYENARAFAGGEAQHDDVAILSVRRSPYG
jgi:serine phosphatase RsbU (regulator of sigma subunit)